jgi:DNA mismatch repair protein MutS
VAVLATSDVKKNEARMEKATPVMRQFLSAKIAHPDALIFFRMGDFYELFYEDAATAARALELTLTSRNKNSEDEIPMAGVPHHAASGYIQKLLDQGFKVAICEQMADPATVKGIVPREVVRVVSPAVAYDDAGLDARKNMYLASIEFDAGNYGVSAIDASTGELRACEVDDAASALAELVRLDPRELYAGKGAEHIANAFHASRPRAVIREGLAALDETTATAILDAALGKGEAEAASRSRVARAAAARCIETLNACEPGKRIAVARLVGYELGETLLLDEATQAHLELVRASDDDAKASLLAQIDATKTASGARLLRRRLLAPLTRVADIRRRLDAVELFVTQPGLREAIRARLGRVSDIERLAMKIATERAAPRDLVALRTSLYELGPLSGELDKVPDTNAREALGTAEKQPWIDPCADLYDLLARAVGDEPPVKASDGNVIRDGFDAQLDEARTLMKDGQRLLLELETRLRETSQIPSMKLRYTRVFGYYLELTKTHVSKAPADWRRKQTVASGERFSCDELDQLAGKILHAEERAASREAELYATLVKSLLPHVERLRSVAARLAEWDVASALADVAHRDDYVRPEIDDSLALDIVESRHPVVEKISAAGRFVANDVSLDATPESDGEEIPARLWLVTGPNMAGKSTLMRQVALTVILAQMGSFVPAKKAHIGVVDRVLTRVGASDNLARGDSTFMVEMKETANVLRRATRRSLVVLDEIGRGTSTYDGLAIAWAVAEHLHDIVGCRALFATHYHELTELTATRTRAENWSVSAREHDGDIVFLHKLSRGAASRSFGVACARLAGVPEIVIARARLLLEDLETGAPLPGGSHATMRGRNKKGRAQLDLFGGAAPAPEMTASTTEVLGMLKSVDVDRLTPLEALQLVASLKKIALT